MNKRFLFWGTPRSAAYFRDQLVSVPALNSIEEIAEPSQDHHRYILENDAPAEALQ